MATYKVILNGVQDGLEVSQVAPQLALLCKIPVEGAMALLASPGMVIKRALNPEMAGTYKAALRSVGCKALVEQDTDASSATASVASRSTDERNRVALNAQDARQHLGALGKRVRNAVAVVAGSAQRYVAQAGRRMKSVKAVAVDLKAPVTAEAQSKATAAQPVVAAPKAKKSLRAYPLVIASMVITSVAIAGIFVSSGPSSVGPCPGEYDAAKWTNCVGEVRFPNGEKYVGEIRDGQPNGQGAFIWPNGERYVGGWKDGQRNGQGTFVWPDGAKYAGEFRNNKKHGQGTLTYANGRKYIGEFKDGHPKSEGGNQKTE